MNFDCKKFTEEEAREFRVSTLSKIRKVGEMRSGDRIYGAIGGNLKIDERYGYDLEDDKRLIFHYPDPGEVIKTVFFFREFWNPPQPPPPPPQPLI